MTDEEKMKDISQEGYDSYVSSFINRLNKISVESLKEDLKRYLNDDKLNMIDTKRDIIQVYPNPQDLKYPNLKDFAEVISEIFDFGDVTFDKYLAPESLYEEFENKMKEAEKAVNKDKEFWKTLKEEMIKYYEPMPECKDLKKWKVYEQWKNNRWKKMELRYDPEPLPVRSIHKKNLVKNVKTGEIVREEEVNQVISDRIIPAGFMIDII